ncbi:hypothetical protein D030_3561B, partial [Vibrio parahaemolyticus AQ3810]
LHQLAWVHMPF